MKKIVSIFALFVGFSGVVCSQSPCGGTSFGISPLSSFDTTTITGDLGAATSYTCNNACYLVTGGQANTNANTVYEIGFSGAHTSIQGLTNNVTLASLTSYKCTVYGEERCYVVTGGTSGAGSNVVYEVNANGTLSAVPSHGLNTGVIGALTSYECEGVCYVVSGGQTGATSNVVYRVDSDDGTLIAIAGHGLSTGPINGLTSFECGGNCYVVSGGTNFGSNPNNVYIVDPYDGTLSIVSGSFAAGNISAVTSYTCDGVCYVATGGSSGASSNNVYELDPVYNTFTSVPGHGLQTGFSTQAMTSYFCNNTCFLLIGGNAGSNSNILYSVNPDGTLSIVTNGFLDTTDIRELLAYDCFGRHFVVKGSTTGNVIFLASCGFETLNNLCTCVNANTSGNVIDVSQGHCTSCFDELSVTITDSDGDPVVVPHVTPLGGSVTVDEYGIVTYDAPASGDICTPDTFFFSATDCSGDTLGCAKVSIFLATPSADCDCNLAIELELTCVSSDYDGSIVVTVDPDSGSGYDFTVTLDGGDAMIAEAPYYQVTYPGLAVGTYAVKVVDNGQTQCMATAIIDIEECAQPSGSCGSCSTNVTVVRN